MMLYGKPLVFIPFIITLGLSEGFAKTEVFESTETKVSLLELYTSEGCSSCPPADKWFSLLKNDKRLWKELIPIAFHVDYWNYIGWKDRFSSPDYSDRQRRYADTKNIATVYTPGLLLNATEWRFFYGLRELDTRRTDQIGKLSLRLDYPGVNAMFRPNSSRSGDLVFNIVLLGFDLSTKVTAGENIGLELKHDFVVLSYRSVPFLLSEQGYSVSTQLPKPVALSSNLGVAAWVSTIDDQTPIQAVGGWFQSTE